MIVGYANERVNTAVSRELARGLCHTLATEVYADLAQHLVDTQRGADWAAFALNGTDVVSLALVVARAASGRAPVVIADGSFHGNLPWVSAGPGWNEVDRCLTRTVPWGDADALVDVLEREPVAAVLLCPYEQLVGAPNRLPPAGYWDIVRQYCDATATPLVIDDVRSGFRLHRAGSCAYFGIDPDLVCMSKAMGNGYPISALIGRDPMREAVEKVFVTGSFWGYAPALAAALATTAILGDDSIDAYAYLAQMGRRLTRGLIQLGALHGVELSVSGPDALPLVSFADDPNYELACAFAHEMAARGSFVHPTHNWFLSLAHRPSDIDATLEHAETALARLTPPS
jgi:glutamate-1-semialdehyde 2,1-aminomutase